MYRPVAQFCAAMGERAAYRSQGRRRPCPHHGWDARVLSSAIELQAAPTSRHPSRIPTRRARPSRYGATLPEHGYLETGSPRIWLSRTPPASSAWSLFDSRRGDARSIHARRQPSATQPERCRANRPTAYHGAGNDNLAHEVGAEPSSRVWCRRDGRGASERSV